MITIDELVTEIRRNRSFLRRLWNADKMIFSYADVPARENRVNLHIGDLKRDGFPGAHPDNLGDRLAVSICEFFLEKRGIRLDQPVKGKKHLFTIGSGGLGSFADGTIWGTGIIYDGLYGGPRPRYRGMNRPRWWEKYWDAKHRKLDIRAVRGPLSREVFLRLGHDCPEIYGDPGILLPMMYSPPRPPENLLADYKIIPQSLWEDEARKYIPADKIISMRTKDYRKVIDQICACKRVYSSSLHGIILAEAYGVPAVFYRVLPWPVDFKYKDWYASTGRFDVPLAGSLVEAMRMEPPELPDLTVMQQQLVEVFPYDLWTD